MQARYNPDIINIEANLAAKKVTLAKVVDVDALTPKMPPDALHSGLDAYTQFWVRTHPGNKAGELQISVTAQIGPESPLTDPVDDQASGLAKWIADHTAKPSGVTPVA